MSLLIAGNDHNTAAIPLQLGALEVTRSWNP